MLRNEKLILSFIIIFISLPFSYLHKNDFKLEVNYAWSNYLTNRYSNIHSCKRPIGTRYDYLKGKYTYLISINLYNNQEILPAMMHNVIKLVDQYFMNKIHLRIFESGSSDKTKKMLRDFHLLLEPRNITYEIETSPISKSDRDMNRIDYLVFMRNYALQPLLKNRIKADFVLFLNDVLYCFDDVLELLHQQINNGAYLVSGMDYMWTPWRRLLFYDSWVTQDIDGIHPNAHQVNLGEAITNLDDKRRAESLLPVQMLCLWNGMVSINATIFDNIEFRRGLNGKKGDTTAGECSASEITSLCLDLIKHGYGKILMVPQVKVAYNYESFNMMKFEENDFTKKYKLLNPHHPNEDKPIKWKPLPLEQDCWPYYTGDRGRDKVAKGDYLEKLPFILDEPESDKRYID